MRLEGIHHVTCITGDAPRNVDFYARVLGLRLVKKTVNQDDPTVYHLFYADEQGSAGADITFFEYPGARRGRAGAGMVHRSSSASAPRRRSTSGPSGWGARASTSSARRRCCFADPEGLALELRRSTTPATSRSSREHPEIPAELALAGLRRRARVRVRPGAQPRASSSRRSASAAGRAAGRRAATTRGGCYAYDAPPAEPRPRRAPAPCTTSPGPRTTEEHEAWRERVAEAGAQPTPVIDRFYFRSIYFREPSGVLFEIATLGAGLRRPTRSPSTSASGSRCRPRSSTCATQLEPRADAAAEPARDVDARERSARERPAAGEPEGALVLLHGRGADEHDLFPLLDALDPERRLLGHHAARAALAAARRRALVPSRRSAIPTRTRSSPSTTPLAGVPRRPACRTTGPSLGGFSQGAVMTYALGLGPGRPRPAALLALSGFIPDVEGCELDLAPPFPRVRDRPRHVRPGHPVEFGHRAARDAARGGGRRRRSTASRRSRTRSTRP